MGQSGAFRGKVPSTPVPHAIHVVIFWDRDAWALPTALQSLQNRLSQVIQPRSLETWAGRYSLSALFNGGPTSRPFSHDCFIILAIFQHNVSTWAALKERFFWQNVI